MCLKTRVSSQKPIEEDKSSEKRSLNGPSSPKNGKNLDGQVQQNSWEIEVLGFLKNKEAINIWCWPVNAHGEKDDNVDVAREVW